MQLTDSYTMVVTIMNIIMSCLFYDGMLSPIAVCSTAERQTLGIPCSGDHLYAVYCVHIVNEAEALMFQGPTRCLSWYHQ